MSGVSASHNDAVHLLRVQSPSLYSTANHQNGTPSSNKLQSATQWFLGAGALCACAATLVLLASASEAQVLAIEPLTGRQKDPMMSLMTRRTASLEAEGTAPPMHPAVPLRPVVSNGPVHMRPAMAVEPQMGVPSGEHSTWTFLTISVAFFAIPVAVVYHGRRIFKSKNVPGAVDLFCTKPATNFSLKLEVAFPLPASPSPSLPFVGYFGTSDICPVALC